MTKEVFGSGPPTDAGAKYYKNFLRMISNPLPEMQEYFDKEFDYLSQLVTPTSKVMDVGAGPGRLMMRLGSKPVQQIDGVESDQRMIGAGEQLLHGMHINYRYIPEDFFYVKANHDYDLVFASYNFPGADDIYPEERVNLLKHMIACTRPGGDTVVSFWKPTGEEWLQKYYADAGAKIEKIEGNVVHTNVGTFTRFTDDEIKEMADSVGVPYTIVHVTPMFDLVHFKP